MSRRRRFLVLSLSLCLGILLPWGLSAQEAASLPEFDFTGFQRIFDGRTLENLDGDTTYWSVEDGVLVGTVTPETLLKKNSWLLWRGGQVEDFELVLDYRVSAAGNSGVGYRLAVLEDDPFSVRGPQADIHGADMFTGICYEENGRRLLAARGQTTRIDPDQLPQLIAQRADPGELQSFVRKGDWNRYHLIVRGPHAQHFINGALMSEVYDDDNANRMKRGLIGVQVHVGPPMTIEFRNIFLKHLGESPDAATQEPFVYKSGTLREPDHGETFNHLAEQAARITAAPADEPTGGKHSLEIVTRELALVRSDLRDVQLHGPPQPKPEPVDSYDLVVRDGDATIRVPRVGNALRGKPLDRAYRLKLQWDRQQAEYKLLQLTEQQEAADRR
jgi:hypothetical protein